MLLECRSKCRPSRGFHRGESRNSIDRFLIAILANLVDKRWRKSYIILSTRYANSPLGNACVRAWWPVLSLSADIIFDTRVLFTTLNVTRPTSHLFYISRCYHDRNRVIFTLARSYEYFIEGLSLSAVISGRKAGSPFPVHTNHGRNNRTTDRWYTKMSYKNKTNALS